jgi:NitT/TauT family transport system substrate-binding protein
MKKSIVLIILFVIVLGLCGGFYLFNQKKGNPSGGKNLEKVTVRLKWLHQAQFAGMYIAREKGYYQDEGLDVELTPFSFTDPTIDAVANGKAVFGVTGADELVLARAKGLPLKAFGVIYKINPVCAYSLKSSGITKPQDFIGKTVGLERAADGTEVNIGILYATMMSKLGINRSKIHEITIGYDATELLAGKTDVSTGYIINEPQLAVEAGKEVNTILMADYGANMYADVLFAQDEVIKNNPGLVNKFLRATIKGWQYAIENESEAVDATLKYAAKSNKSHEAYMLHSSIPLINTGNSAIGFMEESKWDDIQNILFDQKILKNKINITDVYTLEFQK